MAGWMIWFMVAALLVVLEMATGTLYLLMLGIGVAAGGVAALVGASIESQILVAAVAGAATIFALRKSKAEKMRLTDAANDPNVNLDIGQSITVDEWTHVVDGVSSTRTRYRGALWDVELARDAVARPGSFVIREVRGNRLIVSNDGPPGRNNHSQ